MIETLITNQKCGGKAFPKWEVRSRTLRGPSLQKHHQNSTRRAQKGEERMKNVSGEGKRAKFWASHPSGPPPFGVPFLPLSAPILPGPTMTHTRSQIGLTKIRLEWPSVFKVRGSVLCFFFCYCLSLSFLVFLLFFICFCLFLFFLCFVINFYLFVLVFVCFSCFSVFFFIFLCFPL